MNPPQNPAENTSPEESTAEIVKAEAVLATAQAAAAKEIINAISDALKSAGVTFDGFTKLRKAAHWHGTARFFVALCGGLGVLILAGIAAIKGQWEVTEKLAIPALSFFAGVLAGK